MLSFFNNLSDYIRISFEPEADWYVVGCCPVQPCNEAGTICMYFILGFVRILMSHESMEEEAG